MSEDITEVEDVSNDVGLGQPNTRDVCRLCSSAEGCRSPIFADDQHGENDPLSYRILACVSVEVLSNDLMSTLICQSCLKNVNDWSEFKKLCDSAQVKQREWLGRLRADTHNGEVVTVKIERDDGDEIISPTVDGELFAPTLCIKQEDIDIGEEELQIEPISSHDPLSLNARSVKREAYAAAGASRVRRDQDNEESYDSNAEELYEGNEDASPGEVSIESDVDTEPLTNRERAVSSKARIGGKFKGLFKCPICSKQFATNSLYRRHERTHSGVKYPCRFCPVLLGSSSSLHRHQRGHTGFKPFSCATCHKQLSGRSEYWKHRLICTGATNLPSRVQPSQPQMMHVPLSCKVCNMPFSNKVGLLAHMSTHNRTCRWCKRTFSSRIGLSNHMKVHVTYGRSTNRTSRKYRCKLCPQVFANWSQVVKHRVVHVNNEAPQTAHENLTHPRNTKSTNVPHTCQICSETFPSWRDLIIHQKCHSRPAPKKRETAPSVGANRKPRRYYCRGCPDYFKSWYDLVKHRDREHSNNRGQRTLPNPLSKQNPTIAKVKANSNVTLPNRNVESPKLKVATAAESAGSPSKNVGSPGYCHVCGYDFRSSYALARHSAKHTNLKRYSCYVCSARMKYGTSVQNHLKTVHGVIVDHKSIIPDAIYNAAQSKILAQLTKVKNVKQEANRNTPSPNNTCQLCDEVFPTKKLLLIHHQQSHKDVKQFRCESCPQTFISNGNLVRHTQLYHSRIPSEPPMPHMKIENQGTSFSCSICHVRFSSKKSWRNHQRLKNHWDTSQIKIRIYSCTECSNSYNSASALHSHKTTEHERVPTPLAASTSIEPENPYTCQLCHRPFKSNIALKIHTIRSHRGPRKFKSKKASAIKGPTSRTLHECDLCGKGFGNENALKTHRGWHSRTSGGKTLKLKYEQNNTNQPINISTPNTESTGLDEVDDGKSCTLCDRTFLTVQAYKMHYRWHMKTPKNLPLPVNVTEPAKKKNTEQICHLCGKSFFRAKAFEIHYNWHMRNPSSLPTSAPNPASTSPPVSAVDSEFDSEPEAEEPEAEESEELPCHICGKPFYSSRALKTHHTWHLKTPSSLPTTPALIQEGENTCQLCGKYFSNQKSFKIHYGWHLRKPSSSALTNAIPSPTPKQVLQPNPVPTIQLKQEFVNASASTVLGRSIPDANDFGEFECEYCDKSCATVQALRCHMGWHTRQGLALPPKTIQNVKQERFVKPPTTQLSQTSVTSDGDGAYTCNICDQSFKTAKACISHQGWHTRGEAGKLFKCEVCHKSFASRGNLSKHRRLSCSGYGQNDESRVVGDTQYAPRTPPSHGKRGPATGKGDFSCDICQKPFKYLKAVATHKITQHANHEYLPSPPIASTPIISPPIAFPLEQGECIQLQSQSNDLGTQLGSNKRFSCDVCSQRFISQKAFTIHRNLHFRSRKGPSRMNPMRNMDQNHSCTICHEAFSSRVLLTRHRQVHFKKMFPKTSKMPTSKEKHTVSNEAKSVETQPSLPELPVESENNSTLLMSSSNETIDLDQGIPEGGEENGAEGFEEGGEENAIEGIEENGLLELEPSLNNELLVDLSN